MTIDNSQNPTLLSYSCYVQQAMPLSHYTSCSHAVKNPLWSQEDTDNTDKAGHFWYEQGLSFKMVVIFKNSNNKYPFLAL